jgi:transposase-like protein
VIYAGDCDLAEKIVIYWCISDVYAWGEAISHSRVSLTVANRNHGRRVDGPWVFGLILGHDVRYFYVPRRDALTLLPIIQREVEAGSTIHSDEWAAYRGLRDLGFDHRTVNHQEAYVDGQTGVHTQSIERSWLDAKVKILKKSRGVPMAHLQSHAWTNIVTEYDTRRPTTCSRT